MKILNVLLLIALLALQIQLWRGQGGLRTLENLRSAMREQESANIELEQRNRSLAAEVEDLKAGREAIEERARSEIGMIKQGEIFYQTVDAEPMAEESP